MSLKFNEKIRKVSLSQNYLVLTKKSVFVKFISNTKSIV